MSKTKVHTVYKTKDGKRVCGVTTFLSMLAKPALIHWAWNLGCKGEDYRKVRDKAASIGTIAHYLIECYLKKEEADLSDYSSADIEKAKKAMEAFLDFEKVNKLEPIKLELPLVSEKYRFGGTIDCYGKLNGKLCLIDFKTSNGVWPEMRVQIAAYAELLKENGYKVEDIHLLKIDKESGEFSHYQYKDLSIEWKFFKLIVAAYPLKSVIWKKR